eukprot:sb/3470090/
MRATFVRLVEQILSDVDYVAAITVGETAEFLTCHRRLMRATKVIKRMLVSGISGLEIGGVSDWVGALTLAFETLNTNKPTANCEKSIVIMSDETAQPLDRGNEPLLNKDVAPTWSNAYKDLGKIGMVVTATLPLVVETSASQRLLTSNNVTFLEHALRKRTTHRPLNPQKGKTWWRKFDNKIERLLNCIDLTGMVLRCGPHQESTESANTGH